MFYFCRSTLVMFTNPFDDPVSVDGDSMFKIFGRGEQMESEIMDYIISYWKDDPDVSQMFQSGDRVLLGPYTIPVSILTFIFLC